MYSRTPTEFDGMALSRFAKWMTSRDIAEYMDATDAAKSAGGLPWI